MSTAEPPPVKHTILAVDDEEDILAIIKATLESEGFNVQTNSKPTEAVAYYETHHKEVKLVLLDYVMPGMSGDEVLECLQAVNPDVRVLLLTACDDMVAKQMFAKGLRGYMQKPFYLDDLVARVREEIEAD